MNKRTFLRFSGTASSCKIECEYVEMNSAMQKGVSYETVPLTAVHEAVHNVNDLKPQI